MLSFHVKSVQTDRQMDILRGWTFWGYVLYSSENFSTPQTPNPNPTSHFFNPRTTKSTE